jgi:hypothetical protein
MHILKWNLVWLFTMMSYRSSLSFVVIDQYLTELRALGLTIFMINFSYIEKKLGMIVYNDEIKCEFLCYWSIFDRIMGLRILNFHENFCFPDIFWINFSEIEMKLGIIVYNNKLQIMFEFRCYWSIFKRVMGPWTFLFSGHAITLQKNLTDLRISWVFHVLLYCRIYASAFSLIALKIKLKFSMGLQ